MDKFDFNHDYVFHIINQSRKEKKRGGEREVMLG